MRYFVGFCCLFMSAASGLASSGNDLEGIWFGGYRQGSAQINVELRVLGSIGQLEVKAKKWNPINFGTCQYVFEAKQGNIDDLFINSASSNMETCPQQVSLSLSRVEADTINLKLNSYLIEGVSEMPLSAGLRPFNDADRRGAVPNLDILGVATGMNRSEVESILAEKNFVEMEGEKRTGSGTGFKREIVFYGREKDSNGKYQDVITVSYTADFDEENVEVKSVIVARFWSIPDSAKLSVATLREALGKKHGMPSSRYDDWKYKRDGTNIVDGQREREVCPAGSVQEMPYIIYGPNHTSRASISPYCGPVIDVQISEDLNTGRAKGLKISVVDPDTVWADFWTTWSVDERIELKQKFETIADSTGSAPEL